VIDSDEVNSLIEKLESDLIFRIRFLWRILKPVSVEEPKKNDGWLYVAPDLGCFVMVCPDGYACKLAPGDLRAVLNAVFSSRWGDAVLQAADGDPNDMYENYF